MSHNRIPNRARAKDLKGNVFKLTDTERHILMTIGQGNQAEGLRICVMWGAHFWNLGLTTEMDLRHIGLVTVSSTDQHPNE